jgi:hypothetical protein
VLASALFGAFAASAFGGKLAVRTGVQAAALDRSARIQQILRESALEQQAHGVESAGTCVATGGMSILFTSEATAGDVQGVLEALPEARLARFAAQSRWVETATDGPLEFDQALTITYSFIADGTLIESFSGEPPSPSNLVATMNARFPGGFQAFRQVIAESFDRWAALTNIRYVEVADDSAVFGPATSGPGNDRSPGVPANPPGVIGRGDIRIGGHTVGDTVLAYNFFPEFGGDMVFDTSKVATFADPAGNFRSLVNTITHEHGHGLGMAHVFPVSNNKLMEPFLNLGFDGPQEDDIRAVLFLYADPFERNDFLGEETQAFETPLRGVEDGDPVTVGTDAAAIERQGAEDLYKFEAETNATISVRVEPLGTTYVVGPAENQVSTVNARASRDLAVRVLRLLDANTGDVDVVAQASAAPAGQAEVIPLTTLPQAGTYIVQVLATDAADDVQRYSIEISNEDLSGGQGGQSGPAGAALVVREGDHVVGNGATLDFSVAEGVRTHALTFTNEGDAPLRFFSGEVNGANFQDFEVGALQAELAPGQSFDLDIRFASGVQTPRTARLRVDTNDAQAPAFNLELRANVATAADSGKIAMFALGQPIESGSTLDAGEQPVGTPLALEIELKNVGGSVVNLSDQVQGEGNALDDLQLTADFPAALQPGESRVVTIDFTPSVPGVREAKLTFVHDGEEGGATVIIRALGLAGVQQDCNANGREDADDLGAGFSRDCDRNGVPDDCQPDSDGDGVIDACDAPESTGGAGPGVRPQPDEPNLPDPNVPFGAGGGVIPGGAGLCPGAAALTLGLCLVGPLCVRLRRRNAHQHGEAA